MFGVLVCAALKKDLLVEIIIEPGDEEVNLAHDLEDVETLVEMMDMREAMRSYEANLNMIENSRRMQERTLDLLRR